MEANDNQHPSDEDAELSPPSVYSSPPPNGVHEDLQDSDRVSPSPSATDSLVSSANMSSEGTGTDASSVPVSLERCQNWIKSLDYVWEDRVALELFSKYLDDNVKRDPKDGPRDRAVFMFFLAVVGLKKRDVHPTARSRLAEIIYRTFIAPTTLVGKNSCVVLLPYTKMKLDRIFLHWAAYRDDVTAVFDEAQTENQRVMEWKVYPGFKKSAAYRQFYMEQAGVELAAEYFAQLEENDYMLAQDSSPGYYSQTTTASVERDAEVAEGRLNHEGGFEFGNESMAERPVTYYTEASSTSDSSPDPPGAPGSVGNSALQESGFMQSEKPDRRPYTAAPAWPGQSGALGVSGGKSDDVWQPRVLAQNAKGGELGRNRDVANLADYKPMISKGDDGMMALRGGHPASLSRGRNDSVENSAQRDRTKTAGVRSLPVAPEAQGMELLNKLITRLEPVLQGQQAEPEDVLSVHADRIWQKHRHPEVQAPTMLNQAVQPVARQTSAQSVTSAPGTVHGQDSMKRPTHLVVNTASSQRSKPSVYQGSERGYSQASTESAGQRFVKSPAMPQMSVPVSNLLWPTEAEGTSRRMPVGPRVGGSRIVSSDSGVGKGSGSDVEKGSQLHKSARPVLPGIREQPSVGSHSTGYLEAETKSRRGGWSSTSSAGGKRSSSHSQGNESATEIAVMFREGTGDYFATKLPRPSGASGNWWHQIPLGYFQTIVPDRVRNGPSTRYYFKTASGQEEPSHVWEEVHRTHDTVPLFKNKDGNISIVATLQK